MDLLVEIISVLIVVAATTGAYLYIRKVDKRKKAEADAAWRKEVSRQKRSNSAKAAALRKSNPELAKVQAQQQQDAMNALANAQMGSNNLGAFPNQQNYNGAGLYGRGDL